MTELPLCARADEVGPGAPQSDGGGVRRLRVGSWPGYGFTHNEIVRVLLEALEREGCAITSLEQIEDLGHHGLDIILLHWAERVFWGAPNRRTLFLRMARMIWLLAQRSPDTRVVWLVHNLRPHDARPLQRLVWGSYIAALARQVDAVLTLSPGTIEAVQKAIPGLARKPASHVWHPAYPCAVFPASCRKSSRLARGWSSDERVIGYCGQVRAYKGIDVLVEAFRRTRDPALRLLVAGRPLGPGVADRLEQAARSDPRIRLELGDLDTPAFREALGVSDIIAAPFRDYLHSGSLVHALSAARPVLTPSTPFSQSLRDTLGGQWVRTYDGKLDPALLEAEALAPLPIDAPDLTALAPQAAGRQAARFFRDILASR